MRRIVLFSLVAMASCKRHEVPQDATPPPGASRGDFKLTYYWPDHPPDLVTVMATTHAWGSGVADRELQPYRSVAVDKSVIPIGTHLWLEELAGATMPAGTIHDGCVIADDIGGKIIGAKIDFFVPDKAAYTALDRTLHITTVTVHDGGDRCK